ncbi:DUF2007 domain-containing protein [Thalassotalea psychrophila]|uniref:DUF2007 domain-containing protein n=1 Tax=Thalassotalea psychrophila TaxID=3065647 RepID=A0ABY9TW28_9GAMM|nr:DUF2007 domain-containing protein [Colwelliaceae bacterium SQ149]
MICIYEASSAVEAHMISNLLEQSNIEAQIHGEHLQGGVGELQAVGIVRVMVNDEDVSKAKEIVIEWDRKQPESDTEVPVLAKTSNGLGKLFLGFIVGAISVGLYYNTPVSYDGIDFNNDGTLDERWTYRNYRLVKTEIDRNLDGKIDTIHNFNSKGWVKKTVTDEDFNGSFETKLSFVKGNVSLQETDIDEDGFNEYRIEFKDGVLSKAKFLNPATKSVVKIQYFKLGKLVSAEYDSNKDSIIDTEIKYDEYEEIVSSTSK